MANDFMGLDAGRKFGFSRMGMSLGEQREKESEITGVKEGVQNFKRRERIGRRAYRQALRSGDAGAAYNVLNDMDQRGLSSGGVREAGAVEQRLMSQFESRKSMLTPQGNVEPQAVVPPQQAAASQGVPILGDLLGFLSGRQDLPQAQPAPQPQGLPSQSVLVSNLLNPRQQFAADLDRSPLIQVGDQGAMNRAFSRGESLGVGKKSILSYLNSRLFGE